MKQNRRLKVSLNHKFYAIITLLTSLGGGDANAQGQVQIAPLPSPGPQRMVRLGGVTDRGVVFGASCDLSNSSTEASWMRAYLWTKDATNTDMGTLGADGAMLYGANNRGVIVGALQYKPQTSSMTRPLLQAFLGTEVNGITPLPGSGGETVARDINDEGKIVGAAMNASGNSIAAYWAADKNHTLTTLGTLGGISSGAFALNSKGVIVGWSLNASGAPHAFAWNSERKMVDIGPANMMSWAADINDQNQVAGFVQTNEGRRACYWSSKGATILGTLGGQNSGFWSLNNQGIAVGYTDMADKSRHAMGYNGQKMVDLNTLLPKDSGWVLIEARAINNQGQITGNGLFKSQPAIFLMTVTESPKQQMAMRVEPHDIKSGEAARGRVSLSAAAPKGGVLVTLSSADAIVSMPATVTIPEGKDGIDFPVKTQTVKEPKTVVIKASANDNQLNAQTDVKVIPVPQPLKLGISVAPAELVGGVGAKGAVMLSRPAPAGGATITLSSSDSKIVETPANVVIPEGKDRAEFSVKTYAVKEGKSITVKANYTSEKLDASANVRVKPAENKTRITLRFDPATVKGGGETKLIIEASEPTPASGVTIRLSSSNADAVPVPTEVKIPGGVKRRDISIKTNTVTENKKITVKMTAGDFSLEAALTLNAK